MVKQFEKGKKYIFSLMAYKKIMEHYNLGEPSQKINNLDGSAVRVISEQIADIPYAHVWVRPEFCREV